jgi:hypothetical protein
MSVAEAAATAARPNAHRGYAAVGFTATSRLIDPRINRLVDAPMSVPGHLSAMNSHLIFEDHHGH